MSFILNTAFYSLLYSTFIISFYSIINSSPKYNWPEDYLTREHNCFLAIGEFGIPTYYCDNACDLSKLGKLPTFDYIIVGSGAAGSVIANRLTLAQPTRKVLLIEAGDEPLVESVSPPFFLFNLNSEVSYRYFAQPSPKYAIAFKNGANWNCGKSIGGSTQINAMLYVCGHENDYNTWATAAGDSSWNYKNILPLMKRAQGVDDPTGSLLTGTCANNQGTTGPITINNADSDTDFVSNIIKNASIELEYPQLNSINCGPSNIGFANIPMTINNGQRESAARAYLVPINNKGNLYVMRNSFVTKVITSKDSTGAWVATGVTVTTSKSRCPTINIKATREVIISAGGLNSPLILQRSGIGKASDLSSCKIKQISDVPTGRNLIDHTNLITFWTMPPTVPGSKSSDLNVISDYTKYLFNSTGYFSRIDGLNYGGFINTVSSSATYPDIELIFIGFAQNTESFDVMMNEKFEFKTEYANQLVNANQNNALIVVNTIVLQPQSRGTVNIGSCSDPSAAPLINANYNDVASDLDTTVRGIQKVCEIMNTAAVINAGIKPLLLNITECNSLTFCSDSYIRCYSKYFTTSLWHPSGTCNMDTTSANGVVNSRLRVFGVKKLRVADASIMPIITSGNTQCPTYTIGEKAADMIIEDNP